MVTNPSLLSFSAFARTRTRPRPSSLVGSSNASMTSLMSTLRRVLAPLTPMRSVIETGDVTTNFRRNWSRNCSRVRASPAWPPARTNAALSSSGVKRESFCSESSGSSLTEARNLASLSLPASPPRAAKSASVLRDLLVACRRSASTTCVSQTEARKFSFWSEMKGAAVCPMTSIFFSRASTWVSASRNSRAATNLCSWSRRRPFCVSSSACNLFSWSSILVRSVSAAASLEPALTSCWRCCTSLRVASIALAASVWVDPAFSQAAFIVSGSGESPPSTRDFVASFAACVSRSTSPILAMTSRLTVACFLSAMPFLMSVSFLVRPSKRDWSLLSSSPQDVAAPSESLLAVSRFMATKVLVPPTTECAVAAAASSSLSALEAWSSGSSPSAMRKGASASETLRTLSSASTTRPSDSATMPRTIWRSARSRIAAADSSSLSCTSFKRAWSLASSSFAAFCARDCVSKKRHIPFSVTWHSAEAVSTALESPFSSLSSAATIFATCLTDSSTVEILTFASSTTRLAAKRCSQVEASFLHLATSP
mmetsp:Transcript_35760/g.99074  ORF Transcript_35760/g.99074 Transcript_35760/m.99074 type:complete len:540 (+) Transcript_35760:2412-4031(+)